MYDHHKAWTGQDFGDRLPSEVFSEQVITCFIDDRFGVTSREYLNLDNVCWECDYPHSDSTWPTSPEKFQEHVVGVPDADVEKISHLNAMRLFNYDPFTPMGGRENCTVGALRATGGGPRHQHAQGEEERPRRHPVGRPRSAPRSTA